MWDKLPLDIVNRILPYAAPTFPGKTELRDAYARAHVDACAIACSPEESDIHFHVAALASSIDTLLLKLLLRENGIVMQELMDPDTQEAFLFWFRTD